MPNSELDGIGGILREWTDEQMVMVGNCQGCRKKLPLRIEPFSGEFMCKECWENVVFNE